jgi:cell division septation protein DedD
MSKKENTTPPKTIFPKKQTRKGLILWIGLTLFVCAWMFVLGILVGREMVPVKFDIEKLQNELATLKEAVIQKELDQYKIESDTDESKTKMGFYETLKKTGDEARLKSDIISRQKESEPNKTASLEKKRMPAQETVPVPKERTLDSKRAPQNSPPAVATSSTGQTMRVGQAQEPAGNKFTIQVASLKDSGIADKLVGRLKKGGYPAYRSIGKVPGKGIWYRVRVGSFNSRTEAAPTLNQLKKEKIDAIIVQR